MCICVYIYVLYTYFCSGELPELAHTLISKKDGSRSIQLGRFSLFQSAASRSQFRLLELVFLVFLAGGAMGKLLVRSICMYFLLRRASDEVYLYVHFFTKVVCEINLYIFLFGKARRTCQDLDFQEKWVSLNSIGPFQLTPELSLQISILAS